MPGNYTIKYSELELPGDVAIHGVITVYDSNGNIIKSFEGLATDPNGYTKNIGSAFSGDTIQGYYYNQLSPNADSTNPNITVSSPITVFSGSQNDVYARIAAMETATDAINQNNTPYELPGIGSLVSSLTFGQGTNTNSNSYISTMFSILGESVPASPFTTIAGQEGGGALLLTPSQISNILAPYGGAGFQNIPAVLPDVIDKVNSPVPQKTALDEFQLNNTNTAISQVQLVSYNFKDTLTANSSGGTTDTAQSYNPDGTTQFTQTTNTSSTGAITATISGTGDTADLNNAIISFAAGTQAVVDGFNDKINALTNDLLSINGSSDTVNINADALLSGKYDLASGADQINLGNTTITVGAGSQATIVGSDGTMIASNAFNGSTSITDLINWTTPGTGATGALSRDWQLSGLTAGLSADATDYTGANATGAAIDTANFAINGGMQINDLNNLSAGQAAIAIDFKDPTSNAPSSYSIDYTNGNVTNTIVNPNPIVVPGPPGTTPLDWAQLQSNYNSNGQLTGMVEAFGNGYSDQLVYNPLDGTIISENQYNAAGNWLNNAIQPVFAFNGGFDFTNSGILTSISVGNAAQDSLSQTADPVATLAAEQALQQAYAVANTVSKGNYKAVVEGGKWNSNVITWSLATTAGTTGAPFSSYMNSSYTALVTSAFQAWASNSGLTFKQVSDSISADIRIGWGNFNTTVSGVLGYTAYQTNAGIFQPDEIVRLEDPSQDALAATNGMLTYSGTQATLYQGLLHEIGHAIGFADNYDPSSVMYYQTTTSNPVIDGTDSTGVQSLYKMLVTTTSFGTTGGQTLTGNAGYQIYNYANGDGADSIINGISTNTGATGELDFGTGITANNLSFSKSADDLAIAVLGSSNKVTIKNWFANNYSQLENIKLSDGTDFTTVSANELISSNTTNQTSETILIAPLAGVANEIQTFSQINAGGAVTSNTYNLATGNDGNITISAASVNILSGTTATITGAHNTIAEAANTTVTLISNSTNGNVINAGGDDIVNMSAMTFITGSVVDSIFMSGGTANGAAGSCYNLFGSNNTVNNANNAIITEFGNNDVIKGGTSNVVYTGVGGGFNITEGTGSSVYVTGNATNGSNGGVDTLNMSNGAVYFGVSNTSIIGAAATVIGSQNTIKLIASDMASVVGGGNNISSSGNGDIITISGNGTTGTNGGVDTLTVSNGIINLAANTDVNISGNNDIISATTGDTINLLASSSVTINGNGFVLTGSTGAKATLNNASGIYQIEFFNPTPTITTEFQNFNSSNVDTKNVFNWAVGGSQVELINPTSTISTEFENFTGANGTGTEMQNTNNLVAGGYQIEFFNPTSAIATEFQNFNSSNVDTKNVFNWVTGGSQVELINPTSTVSTEFENFTGANGTGTETQNTNNLLAGGYQIEFFNPTSAIATEFQNFSSNAINTSDIFNWTAGGSQQLIFSSLPTGVSQEAINYTGANVTGTVTSILLYGDANNDTLTASTSNETLIGNGGYDTYKFARGNGQDVIQNGLSANKTATGELDLGAGIATNQIWLARSGNDLQLDIMGTQDHMTIAGWYNNTYSDLQEIKTATGLKLDSQLAQLVQAMSTYSSTHIGFNPTVLTQAPADNTLQNAITAAWHS